MLSKATAMGIGFVFLATGWAYAGEQTGRYQGATGSDPQGAEQVQFADYGNATNSHYAPADGNSIPAGSVPAANVQAGTTTHYSPADTAAIVANPAATGKDVAASDHQN